MFGIACEAYAVRHRLARIVTSRVHDADDLWQFIFPKDGVA
jgi:hypothetical protein